MTNERRPAWRRILFASGAIVAGLSVAAGAFGAHALDGRLTESMLAVYETGARYAMYHGLAILVATGLDTGRKGLWAAACFLGGVLFFSGSLVTLSLTGIGLLGAVAPIGGVLFLAGWGLLAWRGITGR